MEPGEVGKRTGGLLGTPPGTWNVGSKLGSNVFTKKTTEDAPVST